MFVKATIKCIFSCYHSFDHLEVSKPERNLNYFFLHGQEIYIQVGSSWRRCALHIHSIGTAQTEVDQGRVEVASCQEGAFLNPYGLSWFAVDTLRSEN